MQLDEFVEVVALTIKAALAPEQARNAQLTQALTEARADLAMLRERLVSLECKAAIPGPPGPAGQDGQDGQSFAAGDLECIQAPDDPRLVTLQFRRGDVVTPAGRLTFKGVPVYCGVYQADASYEPGDMVTLNGSLWHATAATRERPGLGNPTWTLAVKCGRDGKDAAVGVR
jgi:hypothetical protein